MAKTLFFSFESVAHCAIGQRIRFSGSPDRLWEIIKVHPRKSGVTVREAT